MPLPKWNSLAGVAAAVIGLYFTPGQAASCNDLPSSTLRVSSFTGQFETVHVVADAQLAETEAALRAAGGIVRTHAGVVASTKLTWTVNIDHHVEQRGESYCAAPRLVDVAMGFAPRQVYLGKENAAADCRRHLVLEHDKKHAQAAAATFEEFFPQTREAVAAALKAAKSAAFDNAEKARQEFEQAVADTLAKMAADFGVRLEIIDKRLDTAEELQKLASCKRGKSRRT